MVDKLPNNNFIISEFEKIQNDMSWDTWAVFEEQYFAAVLDGPRKEPDDFDRQARRQPVNLNGIIWKPVRSVDKVNKDMEFLHWRLSAITFAQLEPDAAAENLAHPERYNHFCIYCEIRTGKTSMTTCPICEHDLVDLPLNDMDD